MPGAGLTTTRRSAQCQMSGAISLALIPRVFQADLSR